MEVFFSASPPLSVSTVRFGAAAFEPPSFEPPSFSPPSQLFLTTFVGGREDVSSVASLELGRVEGRDVLGVTKIEDPDDEESLSARDEDEGRDDDADEGVSGFFSGSASIGCGTSFSSFGGVVFLLSAALVFFDLPFFFRLFPAELLLPLPELPSWSCEALCDERSKL